jgi:hypothetical protein
MEPPSRSVLESALPSLLKQLKQGRGRNLGAYKLVMHRYER